MADDCPPGSAAITWLPALAHPDLLAPRTRVALTTWTTVAPEVAEQVHVAAVDPSLSDTAAMSDAYEIPMRTSVNCVLVAGRREGVERTAAIAVRASTRADVNGAIRRLLEVRKASFVAVDRAVQTSGMEYGGITPIGLEWRVLLDSEIAEDDDYVVIGSGLRRSKIALPGSLLARLPGVHSLEHLALR